MRKLNGDHCQCTACGEYFNSIYAFDLHRTGSFLERKCLSVDEMLEYGIVKSSTDWWISEKRDYTRALIRKAGDQEQAAT